MQKNKKIIIITISVIIIVSILIFSSTNFFMMTSFTKNHYVDFPSGYRPWHENYGDPGVVPLVVEGDDRYAQWKLYLTIENPQGQSKSITYYPTVNHPDYMHPDNWLNNGPFYIFIDMYPTWNIIGLYTITALTLEAVSASTWEWEIIDYLDEDYTSRKSIEVRYYPETESTLEIKDSSGQTSNYFVDGEEMNIHYFVKNTFTQTCNCCIRIYVDTNQNGEHDSSEYIYKDECSSSFAPNNIMSGVIQTTADYDKSNNGVLHIGLEIFCYTDDNTVWGVKSNKHSIVTVEGREPPSLSITLTITTNPTGQTILVYPNKQQYNKGDIITLTALEDNLEFIRWTGSYTSTNNPVTIVLNSDTNIIATYRLADGTIPPDSSDTPGFEFLFLLIGILLSVVILKKRQIA